MIKNSIIIFLSLFLTDTSSIYITKFLSPDINIKKEQNIRWFFIHSISNLALTLTATPDLITVLKNPLNTLNISWNKYSYITFEIGIIIHLYHILFFKLTPDDIFHHFLMIFIAGPIEFYNKNIICSATLFFLSGLPGAIDYFLLYLVKNKRLSKIKEKKIYVFLSSYIRSPGCCIISYINIYNIYYHYQMTFLNKILSVFSTFIVFWNGQYYLSSSSISYGRFLEKKNKL